jgi:hypothetical protein
MDMKMKIPSTLTFNFNTFNFVPSWGLFFRRACYYQNVSYRKNEWIERCRQTFDLQSWFCSFLAQNSTKQQTMGLARNGPKCPSGPKLEAITVM